MLFYKLTLVVIITNLYVIYKIGKSTVRGLMDTLGKKNLML
jgi:hypothetical protein